MRAGAQGIGNKSKQQQNIAGCAVIIPLSKIKKINRKYSVCYINCVQHQSKRLFSNNNTKF
jgi:hypothetical protein